MPVEKDIATFEMTIGGIAIAAGFFLLQLPPNWWPGMVPFLVHVGVSLGLALATCGVLLFSVGASRWSKKHSWQDALVNWWDKMRNSPKFYPKFFGGFVLVVAVITTIWSAFAQEKPASGPITVEDRSKCPLGYIVLDSNTFSDNGTAIQAPAEAKICLVKNEINRNKTGLDLR